MKFSNFLLGANVHPPNRKTTTTTSPIRFIFLVATLRMSSKRVMYSTFGHFFGFVHFCPYKEVVRGKPKKGMWLGKIKTNGANSPLTLPPPKSPPPTSTLFLYLPWPSPLVPMMVWWWGMTPMCPFSDFKKRNHVTASFRKTFFQKMDLPLPWFCSSFWIVKIC